MTTRPLQWVLVATIAAGAAACNREEPKTYTEATQAQPQRDDSWITTSVQAKYYGTDDVRGRDITVVARDGAVTLRGAVESESARQRAVALAKEVEGVKQVNDELRVEPQQTADARVPGPSAENQPTGTSGRSDVTPSWITTKIQAQYFANPEVKPWNIDVTTSNEGVVTLEGEVEETADKTEAVRIARATEGVARVEDRLRVKREMKAGDATANVSRPDAWLTAKVQSKYFLDDEVKGRDIDVTTNNGAVTLTGTVETEAQRRQAIAIARNTEGVRDVVDRLQVTPSSADTRQGSAEAHRDARDRTARPAPVADLSRPDEWITMKVQSKFFLDPDVKGRQVNVDTRKGVVTLQGTVSSAAEKQQAEQIARDTEGVARVVNQLTVSGSGGA